VQGETQTLSMFFVFNQFISLKSELTQEILTLLRVLCHIVQSLGSEYPSL
jgi:hypothetical protein